MKTKNKVTVKKENKKVKEVVKETKKNTEGLKKVSEIRERIKKEQQELIGLILEKVQFKLKNTSSISTKRDQIARLFTALKIVEMEEKA